MLTRYIACRVLLASRRLQRPRPPPTSVSSSVAKLIPGYSRRHSTAVERPTAILIKDEPSRIPVTLARQRFKKILIANRGEIACAIIRTSRRLGVATVAVYSEADKDCIHVNMADEAYCIGPAASSESYLRMDKILDVARLTGAQAIHPGYGFLSESPVFAEQVRDAGLVFIGPPVEAIKSMGSKKESKDIMIGKSPDCYLVQIADKMPPAAGVPCVPGYHGSDQSLPALLAGAQQTGYPLLIKPTHGGGGKGMRVVRDPDSFQDELLSAQREAKKSFGNDEVLLERWLERPRHVEVQVFGDQVGGVWRCGRGTVRCKGGIRIIEEAPAPGLSAELKRDFAEKAVAAAKAINYVGAGTVEFIMDAETGEYFFMEMNTRLQVEHPVTEMITGQDLVEWQLSVAAGNPLPLTQTQIPCLGHAFEARIYAERPESNFLPDAGRLLHARAPINTPHRLETGFKEGDDISSHYDPMIAKLIVHGKNRPEALALLRSALAEYQIVGPSTNIDFLRSVAGHESFASGPVETSFVSSHHDELFPARKVPHEVLAQVALYLVLRDKAAQEAPGPWASLAHRRFSDVSTSCYDLDDVHVNVIASDGGYEIVIRDEQGQVYQQAVSGSLHTPTDLLAQVGTTRLTSTIIPVLGVNRSEKLHVFSSSSHYTITHHPSALDNPTGTDASSSSAINNLVSPMPATVIEVKVGKGDVVKENQVLCVLESMKMEINVRAGSYGVVGDVRVVKGKGVEEGEVLIVLEPAPVK